jgi:hypothetical protein
MNVVTMGVEKDMGDGKWFRASGCTGEAACVEVGYAVSQISGEVDGVRVRDTKQVDAQGRHVGPVLEFSLEEWDAFRQGVIAGEFDHPEVGS